MDEAFISSIVLFAGTFAPINWAFCHGQTMNIRDNAALFSLLGTTYGGDGMNTFKLPDLRGAVPVGVGQGTGLPHVQLGEQGRSKSVTTFKAAEGVTQTLTTPTLGLNYIICLNGIYPSRP